MSLLLLWALVVCSRVNFTFTLTVTSNMKTNKQCYLLISAESFCRLRKTKHYVTTKAGYGILVGMVHTRMSDSQWRSTMAKNYGMFLKSVTANTNSLMTKNCIFN